MAPRLNNGSESFFVATIFFCLTTKRAGAMMFWRQRRFAVKLACCLYSMPASQLSCIRES